MGSHFIVEAWTELAIAILVILLRLYSSFIRGGFREMKIDDYLMILVGVSEPDLKQDMCPCHCSC
jgi:hypothetical protein